MQRNWNLTTDVDISQTVILDKIAQYLKIKHRDQSLVDEMFTTGGYCVGFTGLALYSLHLLLTEPAVSGAKRQTCRDDWHWLRSALVRLASWDGTEASLNKKTQAGRRLRRDTERLIALIRQFQDPDTLEPVTQMQLHNVIYDTRGKVFFQEYTLAGLFKPEDFSRRITIKESGGLARVTTLVDEIIKDHRLVFISCLDHIVGIIKHENSYYFYNSNNEHGWGIYSGDSVRELIEAVFAAHFDSDLHRHLPLNVNVLSTNQASPVSYLSQDRLLKAIGASGLAYGDDKDKTSALYMAADVRCRNSVRYYLSHPPEPLSTYVNKASLHHYTPLHVAAREGAASVTTDLLLAGADPDAVNNMGKTPLCLAVEHRFLSTATILLKHKASVNMQTNHGDTALHLAVRNNDTAMTKLLLAYFAPVNVKNHSGSTPFLEAVQQRNANILMLLLERGGLQVSAEELRTLKKAVADNPENHSLQACLNQAVIHCVIVQIQKQIETAFSTNRRMRLNASRKLEKLRKELETIQPDTRSRILYLLKHMLPELNAAPNKSYFSLWNPPAGGADRLLAFVDTLNMKITIRDVENYYPQKSTRMESRYVRV
ncbi:hypothetical protein AQUSIP_18970 [Aquicella siphonis]|uniref:Uncharacterized protein n=1 Tax=Aquicella siphonis TaxID=254247 RepID=A0A5E4PHS5_9COXI|nr:ankyrin repeat domain-containing protein [Aquicella siphonis]VVC76580.1 hypothetical protein AQUSIP_18970 [Aquicella siphonis]